jgi:predicted porin
MKKSLFAIAAVTAFAGAAQAQSSVTAYGIIDVGYIGGNNRGSNGTTSTPVKNTYNQFGTGAESTSRIGFRGREDIGGGTAAIFTIEMQLDPNTQASPMGANRQTFAGLSQKGLGTATVGTQYTVIHTAIGATSANQQNNIVGDVIYPVAPPGQNTNTVGTGTFGVAGTGNAQTTQNAGTVSGYTVRTNNMLRVQSENVAGFVGSAFYTMADNNSTQTATTTTGQNNKNGWGLGVNYTWKKLLVSANYQAMKAVNPTPNGTTGANATATTFTAASNPNIWSGTAAASNIQDNQWYAAAAYDFGILKAYAQYISRKATSELDATQFLSRTAQQVGVRGFVTPKVEGWASVGNGRFDSYGSSTPTVNFTGYQLGSNYWLSKRTNLYAIFGSTQQSSANIASQPSSGANNYAVGARHTF